MLQKPAGFYVSNLNLKHSECVFRRRKMLLSAEKQINMENYIYAVYNELHTKYVFISSKVFQEYGVKVTRNQIKQIVLKKEQQAKVNVGREHLDDLDLLIRETWEDERLICISIYRIVDINRNTTEQVTIMNVMGNSCMFEVQDMNSEFFAKFNIHSFIMDSEKGLKPYFPSSSSNCSKYENLFAFDNTEAFTAASQMYKKTLISVVINSIAEIKRAARCMLYISNDSTFGTNANGYKLNIFVTPSNTNKNCMVLTCFLKNETRSNFSILFQCLRLVYGGTMDVVQMFCADGKEETHHASIAAHGERLLGEEGVYFPNALDYYHGVLQEYRDKYGLEHGGFSEKKSKPSNLRDDDGVGDIIIKLFKLAFTRVTREELTTAINLIKDIANKNCTEFDYKKYDDVHRSKLNPIVENILKLTSRLARFHTSARCSTMRVSGINTSQITETQFASLKCAGTFSRRLEITKVLLSSISLYHYFVTFIIIFYFLKLYYALLYVILHKELRQCGKYWPGKGV